MMPDDPAVWELANAMVGLARTEEIYACAEEHIRRARDEAYAAGYEAGTKDAGLEHVRLDLEMGGEG